MLSIEEAVIKISYLRLPNMRFYVIIIMEVQNMTPTQIRRFIWGATIFGAGIVLLMQAMDLLPGIAWKFVWPTFIVIIGLELMFTSIYKYGEEIEIELSKAFFKKSKKRK
jgi:NO-binding membrane sensor protein with MHYT domain